jgi:hypothetical protein
MIQMEILLGFLDHRLLPLCYLFQYLLEWDSNRVRVADYVVDLEADRVVDLEAELVVDLEAELVVDLEAELK